MVIIKLILFNKSFNYVITVAPPFHLGYLSRLYRKARGGKLVYHIQDLQIDAAQKLNQLKGDQLFNLLFRAERVMLKGSDYVSTISEGMIKTIKTKLDRPIILFPNWADTSIFFPIEDKAGLKGIWGYREDQLICLYSGSIGEKQGLENLIKAAELLKEIPAIQFIICGSGPHKTKLQELTLKKRLKNVAFLPLQSRTILNEFLNMADIHLIMQKAYVSDLVMPSKLFTILATGGVSLVTTVNNTSLHDLVHNFDVGFTVPPDDHLQLAEIIKTLPGRDLAAKQENSRLYALKYLNIDNVMNKFMNDISA
jgi:colanic acid biosynthesis glycosyl transferase WcaI